MTSKSQHLYAVLSMGCALMFLAPQGAIAATKSSVQGSVAPQSAQRHEEVPHARDAAMQRVAEDFFRALRRDDMRSAMKLTRGITPGAERRLEDFARREAGGALMSRVTGADCQGVTCYATGFQVEPPPFFLMNKAKGRWWVAGVGVQGPSGPGYVPGAPGIIYSSGVPGRPGSPQGTTYWRLSDGAAQASAYLRVERRGDTYTMTGLWVGGAERGVSCISGFRPASYFSGAEVQGTEKWGSENGPLRSYTLGGTYVWRVKSALYLSQVYGLDRFRESYLPSKWALSTAAKTLGSGWASLDNVCGAR